MRLPGRPAPTMSVRYTATHQLLAHPIAFAGHSTDHKHIMGCAA